MKIYFYGLNNLFLKHKIKKLLNTALVECPIQFKGFSVNISLTTLEEIKHLNQKHRNIDKETDVLSFPNLELDKGNNVDLNILQSNINPEDGLVGLGDIIICEAVAKLQAKDYGHSYKREVCFLALHGFLHLLGYDHIQKDDEIEMNNFAENTLNKLNVKRG